MCSPPTYQIAVLQSPAPGSCVTAQNGFHGFSFFGFHVSLQLPRVCRLGSTVEGLGSEALLFRPGPR